MTKHVTNLPFGLLVQIETWVNEVRDCKKDSPVTRMLKSRRREVELQRWLENCAALENEAGETEVHHG